MMIKGRLLKDLKKSQAGFDNCVGAIDGMLVWIEKPNKKECRKVGVGSKKFYCGRKKKYGLNLQAFDRKTYKQKEIK